MDLTFCCCSSDPTRNSDKMYLVNSLYWGLVEEHITHSDTLSTLVLYILLTVTQLHFCTLGIKYGRFLCTFRVSNGTVPILPQRHEDIMQWIIISSLAGQSLHGTASVYCGTFSVRPCLPFPKIFFCPYLAMGSTHNQAMTSFER